MSSSMGLFGYALSLVLLYGPGNQAIWVNPAEVVSAREPRGSRDFVGGTRCVVTMVNGNLIACIEPCDVVLKRLR